MDININSETEVVIGIDINIETEIDIGTGLEIETKIDINIKIETKLDIGINPGVVMKIQCCDYFCQSATSWNNSFMDMWLTGYTDQSYWKHQYLIFIFLI